ncbi:cupin domain-containing protein [Algibacillus agarilyticus]|uniref:cupin domain-containing protein n=1 Tax=Algibacillus agarilyticus TaxID=2234133 RepID=UPI000DD07D9D|nr:cupin domain-containing protein [Algibacillus agarilyticus]
MLNMNFAERVVIQTESEEWQPSPSPDVLRKPLAREGLEHGHATSLVTYKPGASFAEHSHPFGEEIFVLEGTFSDEKGDYPAGTYIRNPPGTKHKPFSKEGCVIFVKLNQFNKQDRTQVALNTELAPWLAGQGRLEVKPLHRFEHESVALVKWPAGEKFIPHRHFGGEEIWVLAGMFEDEYGQYPKNTWIRSPHLSSHNPFVLEETVILVKTGHLG